MKKIINKKTVLIVDDDIGITEALSFMLTYEGYKVVIDRGDNVFESIKKHKPFIILLDILLSGFDGREICKSIQRNEEFKDIPIVLLSAHPSAYLTYKKYGAKYFLSKPFDNSKLLEILQSQK